VLAEAAGVLAGRRASSAPGFEARLTANGATFTDLPVTVDGAFITASGPPSALLFALTIVKYLVDRRTAEALATPWKLTLP
jgi:4-methyl-5(b-hydroxyethyl)-thiazole monophosphate biosynthesis